MLKTIIKEFSKLVNENSNFILKIFIAKIINKPIEQIFFENLNLSSTEIDTLKKYISEYLAGKPVSKIIHESCFYGYNFYVNEDVLDPRMDTEILVDAVIQDFKNHTAPLNILDICTGSGVILLTLLKELPNSSGIGLDISDKALYVANKNCNNLNLSKRANFIQSDFCNTINSEKYFSKFDIIVSNPPYIKTKDIPNLDKSVINYDPLIALDGGENGTDAYIHILSEIELLLNPDGKVYFEIGYDILNDIKQIVHKSEFSLQKIIKDLHNIDRVLVLNKKSLKN